MTKIDLEKIKQKLAQLNREKPQNSNWSEWRWKPELGDHTIRVLPWKDSPGEPIKERAFYYGLGKGGMLAPCQFNLPDPVQECKKQLYEEDTEESKNLAKKLYPKIQGYIPVIVRGEEEKGVRIWSFGPSVYKRLYGFFMMRDVGDFTDPMEGRDLNVKISTVVGKKYPDTTVDLSFSRSPISENKTQMKEWLDNIPNLDEKLQKVLGYDEIQKIVTDWLNGPKEGDGKEPIQEKLNTGNNKETSSEKSESEFKDLDDVFADLED